MNRIPMMFLAPDGDGSGNGGGAAAPAPTASTSPAPASGGSSEVNWDGLLADDSVVDEPAPDQSGEPAKPKAGDSPPPATAASSSPAPASGQPPAQAPATQIQSPPSGTPAKPEPTAEEQAAAADEARKQLHEQLSGLYTTEMDDETKSALIASPETVMPKLLARAAMDGAQLAIRHITEQLPQFIARQTQQQGAQTKVWDDFSKAHDDLAKPEYRQTVVAAVNAVKATGIKPADKDAAFAMIARTARAMLGLPDPKGTPAPSTDTTAAPVAPFNPTARGTSRPQAPAKKSDNTWEDLLD